MSGSWSAEGQTLGFDPALLVPLSDLQRFDEGPQQRPDPLSFAQQLNQSHHSKQAKEGDGHPRAVLSALRTKSIAGGTRVLP